MLAQSKRVPLVAHQQRLPLAANSSPIVTFGILAENTTMLRRSALASAPSSSCPPHAAVFSTSSQCLAHPSSAAADAPANSSLNGR